MALITKGGNSQIRTNFNESELQSGSWNGIYTDAPDSFELSDLTLDALQIIRGYYNIPIYINSTGRSPQHNTAINGASSSKHLFSVNDTLVEAIDWRFKDQNEEDSAGYKASIDYYNQMKSGKGALYQKLKAIGIGGIGLYDNFNHIDSRVNSAFWDNSSKKKTLYESLISSFQNNEDGLIDWSKSIIGLVAIILIIVIGVIIYLKVKK